MIYPLGCKDSEIFYNYIISGIFFIKLFKIYPLGCKFLGIGEEVKVDFFDRGLSPCTKNHLQTTVIKKQKEAAMSAEYAEGGFTPDGPKKKVVGVVHAGGMDSESEVG